MSWQEEACGEMWDAIAAQDRARPLEPARSVGHLAFAGCWEFFEFGELQEVYRAPLSAPIMSTNGIRGGARWEATFSWWARYGAETLRALGPAAVLGRIA